MRIFLRRRVYLRWKERRGIHVFAPDCWCGPTVSQVS